MRTWELLRLALGGVRRTPLRVGITSLGVTIATGALVSMVGFGLGIQSRVEEPFERFELLNRIDVSARRPSDDDSGDDPESPRQPLTTKPADPPPVLDDAAVAQMAALPGVQLAYPSIRLWPIEVTCGEKQQSVTAFGLPHSVAGLRFATDAMVAGRLFQQPRSNEAVLGTRLARSLGFDTPEAALGKTLTLKATGLSQGGAKRFSFETRALQVRVVGVWKPPRWGTGMSDRALVLPLDVIRSLPGVHFGASMRRLRKGEDNHAREYEGAVVRVKRPSDLAPVKENLEQMGFRARTILGEIEQIRTAFIIMDFVLISVGTVALVVAALGIINTLLMAVLERYREIGTLKAIGASAGDIRILFLAEAGLVGWIGGVGGLLLGRSVSWIIEQVVNAYAQSKGVTEPVAVFAFPLWMLLAAMVFAVFVSVLSGVYPASRAARVDPIRALRGE